MSLRREQVLFLVVLVLALWIWTGETATETTSRLSPTYREHEPGARPGIPLVAPLDEPAIGGRDPFLEPSETAPLPPRPLPFPERGPLDVVAVPVVPGQGPPAWYQLRVFGGVAGEWEPDPLDSAPEASGSEAPPVEGGVPDALASNGGGGGGPDLLYDTIVRAQGGNLYGFVRNEDKYELHDRKPTVPIEFDLVDRETGEVRIHTTLEPDEVQRVLLARTLRNSIELRKRALGDGPASLEARAEFVEDLLREARREPWIYAVAEQQAREYVRIAGADPAGYRLLLRVHLEKGDLAGAWDLLQSLPPELQGSGFGHCATGRVQALLGLDLAAERHLREGVAAERTDPHCNLALARFLLDRDRPEEALEFAERARGFAGTLSDAEEFEVVETLIAVQLALGEVDAARRSLSWLPTGEGLGAHRDHLKAAVHYAAGEIEAARSAFADAVASGSVPEAALGLAAARARAEQWEDAQAGFRAVAERHPLLRDRALDGAAFLLARTGNLELAVQELESSVRTDPRDAYALYLLGRSRRLLGQLDPAVDALQRALALDDRLVEAHAELAEAHLMLAEVSGADAPEHLYRARRYADRLVELDSRRPGGPAREYRELQGLVRFQAADFKAARESFQAAGDDSMFARAGLALVSYAQNRVEDARARLRALRDELRTGQPMRAWVEETVALIEEHSRKEQLRDPFDREELGEAWQPERSGRAGPVLDDGELVLRGRPAPGRPVKAIRIQEQAGNLLAAEVTMELAPGDRSRVAGLELATREARTGARGDFRVRFGFRDREPYLHIEDGDPARARDDEERRLWDPVDLGGLGRVDPGEPHRLVLSMVPGEDGRRLTLRARLDGVVVHERELQKIHANTRDPLAVALMAEGGQGDGLEVRFDDFRLVRRQEP